MIPFDVIRARAEARHGADALAARLPTPATDAELRTQGDDRYLAAMTKRVFAAGFRWNVIEAKWDGFEQAFDGFDPDAVAAYDLDDVAQLAQDTRIVRNKLKILATIDNARFVQAVAAEHGSFGDWLADWPADDPVGLWEALAAGGNRLGGDTAPWFLRLVGKDTFRFSSDVSAGLVDAGVVDKAPTGKRARREAQAALVGWAAQSGLPLCQVSTILACSIGEVYAGR